jgi:hypothetical protein
MLRTLWIATPIALLAACDSGDDGGYLRDEQPVVCDELTEPEARAAIAQVDEVTRPDRASVEIVDVTADVTVGERLAAAANRWRAFFASQQPCTDVSVDRNVVTVDFGTLDDECAFAGRTYAGVDTITVTRLRDQDDDLQVRHDLDGFTNGEISITGEKTVYRTGDGGRGVRADYTVLDLDTARSLDVLSQHTLRPLDPALPISEGGFRLNGDRSWTDGVSGEWRLAMNHLAFFLDDAAPHDGNVVLTNPVGRTLTIRFSQVDDDTTRAVVRGPRGDTIVFRITVDGDVVEE